MNGSQVRQKFIDFFVQKYQHEAVPSSSVIPLDDPTLLFANAGMNQFKPIFLGTVDPNSEQAKWKRVVNSQKCIRAGGKHNDLDDVGKDVYHHTFFEMLGCWSFGDYFKREICKWSYELLVKEYGLNPEQLYVTYFGGSQEAGLEPDNECKDIWINEVGVPSERVIPGSMKDNFWEMGDTGPCGPCSEIHYDRIGGRNAASLVNMDDPDVLEIWNLVFIQFNREPDRSLRSLPDKHIDTGMGFERITSIIQNKPSNYDTDLFTPIFDAIQQKTGCRQYTGKVGDEDVDGIDMAYRVVADHARTLTIALSDGGRPDNVGRGYVLRRILRRAVRYSTEKLNAPSGMFASLIPVVVSILGDFFPEMKKDPQNLVDIINDEEQKFLGKLSEGRKLLEKTVSKLKNTKVFPGDIAWKLYDTHGFPLDLTHLMVQEKGLAIDMAEYEVAKAEAQALSYSKYSVNQSPNELDVHSISMLKDELKIPFTNDLPKYEYVPSSEESIAEYSFVPCSGKVLALKKDGKFVESVDSNNECGVVLDKTNFYAEAGGQIYDTGFMRQASGGDKSLVEFEVMNVKCKGGYVVHLGMVKSGCLKVGDVLDLHIDEPRRRLIMNNHTGTHVLNFALRDVLKVDTEQKGSLVDPDKLRFDFSLKGPMSCDELKKTEEVSNSVIIKNDIVYAQDAPRDDAKKINGLRAVFGEIYPNPVRVVSIGVSVDDLLADPLSSKGLENSVEFCGGTHLTRSGHIGELVISSEEAIANGIRRVIALTGPAATKANEQAKLYITQVAKFDSDVGKEKDPVSCKALVKQIVELIEEISRSSISYWRKEELRNQLNKLKKRLDDVDRASKASNLSVCIEKAKALAEEHKTDSFIVSVLEAGSNNKILDAATKQVKSTSPDIATLFISCDEKKVVCLSSVPSEKVKSGLKANEWIQSICQIIGGKGGGKPESAQASGTKVTSIAEAINVATEFAKLKLNS
ncbi:alanine--tRNA ligase, cytoplasmic [Brevipalpus obovatus]|uniref:alanine--tRNA ligase, cytoplasmic n=1 Tax=Brevipalpus obovatus TaxID=246614 RepID=UPI003D9F4B7F